jgi:hypothetical protein
MKVFRLEEANALLPTIRPLVAEILEARRDIAIGLLEAQAAERMPAQAASSGRSQARIDRARDLQARIVELVEQIQSVGCTVKDLDLGLVDFPALRGGQLINLCWKMDEPSVLFWHGIDEGFVARKSIARRRR